MERSQAAAAPGSVRGLEAPSPAWRAAGSRFVPAGLDSPRSSVSDDNGTASSAQRIGENRASSGFTRHIKDVPFFNDAKAELYKFERDFITLAKRHGLLQVFTDEV